VKNTRVLFLLPLLAEHMAVASAHADTRNRNSLEKKKWLPGRVRAALALRLVGAGDAIVSRIARSLALHVLVSLHSFPVYLSRSAVKKMSFRRAPA
jgi:hypothetical protein